MTGKVDLALTPEQETLLIPLYARAQPGNPLFFDQTAQDVLDRVDYDFARLHVPLMTVFLICQRAKKLDTITRKFLAEYPGGMVLQLGCGLDNRFWRVDDGSVTWYDLDMPPVVELRRQFFTGGERYHLIAGSVTDREWLATVASRGRPVLVVAEGLLMYLSDAEVRRLVLQLHETFPGCRLIADIFNRFMARWATKHPSLKRAGATIGWGIDDAHQLEAWAPGLRLLEEWYFIDDPDLSRLSPGYRMAYRLYGVLLRRAHRIVYYQL